MISINVMPILMNRLKDRGWKNVSVRGYTTNQIQILKRGNESIMVIVSITFDSTIDVTPQLNDYFEQLKNLMQHDILKDVFLPGGGDIPIPDFFRNYCYENRISIHLVTYNSLIDYINFN
jgi:hypothetical protein